MIEIRQKKQSHHNEIRKKQIQNFFKQIRNQNNQKFQIDSEVTVKSKIQRLIKIANEQNKIIWQINKNNYLQQLYQYIEKGYLSNNYQDIRLLLILITNTLKNNIGIHIKQQILRKSIRLVQSLRILQYNIKQKKDSQKLNNILQTIDPSIIIYYFAQIFNQYKWLAEQDQIWIQKNIYHMFIRILFYTIKSSFNLQFYDQFIQECENCFHYFFDENQQPYEMNNRMKAERNISLFKQIQQNHLQIICLKGQFPKEFQRIQTKLYWFYDYLTTYTRHLKPSFTGSYLNFQIISKQFYMKTDRNQFLQIKIHKYCYSILRQIIDQDILISQIAQLMLKQSKNKYVSNFQIILRETESQNKILFQILEFIQGIVNNFCGKKYFMLIMEVYWKKIMDICLKQIQYFIIDCYSFSKHKLTLIKVLSIVCDLIQFGNLSQNLQKRKNIYLIYFQSLRGMNQLEIIKDFLDQNGDDQDCCIQQIKKYINILLVSIIEIDI